MEINRIKTDGDRERAKEGNVKAEEGHGKAEGSSFWNKEDRVE